MTIDTRIEYGNTVWWIESDKVKSGRVDEIRILVNKDGLDVKYSIANVNHRTYTVEQLFKSKQDLLNSL